MHSTAWWLWQYVFLIAALTALTQLPVPLP